MVIAADVIYEEEQVEPLVRTAAAILKGKKKEGIVFSERGGREIR